jgi:two-component sensor histidine kinase/CHASE3 domain sensor protein
LNDPNAFPRSDAGGAGWRQWLRRSMMPVFLGLTLALVGLGLAIGQTVLTQQDARRHAMAEGDALIALQRILVAMLDAESGQRGYLLSRDRAYLEPYLAARKRIGANIDDLRAASLQSRGDSEDARIGRIEALARAKFEELDRTVALTDAGLHDQALAVVGSDVGKMRMDALRLEIRQLGADKARNRRDAFVRAASLENRLLPLIAVLGAAILALLVAGFRTERSRARSAAQASQAAALREANDRAQLLARELNHRVKNLFSVILSIVTLSARKQAPTAEIIEDIRARIHALSRAHVASQGRVGEATVQLGETIDETMKPYADADGERLRIGGPPVEMPVRMVTPIGLIVHELATNAAKYGALTSDAGTIDISWVIGDGAKGQKELTLSWIESGGPALLGEPQGLQGSGFGSKMIVLAAGQLGGTIEREWPATGAIARVTFPISGPHR